MRFQFDCILTFPLSGELLVVCKTPKLNINNRCVVVEGGITIYTDNGGERSAMDDIHQVLKETIEYGLFNYARMGIVRVSLLEDNIIVF